MLNLPRHYFRQQSWMKTPQPTSWVTSFRPTQKGWPSTDNFSHFKKLSSWWNTHLVRPFQWQSGHWLSSHFCITPKCLGPLLNLFNSQVSACFLSHAFLFRIWQRQSIPYIWTVIDGMCWHLSSTSNQILRVSVMTESWGIATSSISWWLTYPQFCSF